MAQLTRDRIDRGAADVSRSLEGVWAELIGQTAAVARCSARWRANRMP